VTLAAWSLAQIMQTFNLKQFGMSLSDLQAQWSECENNKWFAGNRSVLSAAPARPSAPSDAFMETVERCLTETEGLCDDSGWKAASEQIGLIKIHLQSCRDAHTRESHDWSSLGADLRNAIDLLLSAMWQAKCVMVLSEFSDYINNEAMLGEDVKKAFPSASDDLKEAGNCIAVDCGTAAVFHLMRAVEWGMRALCADLGVLTVPRKKATIPIEFSEWDKILDQVYPAVSAKIDALPPGTQKQELQEFYFPLLLDIRGFKDAFRNHVMHTRQTYSQKAADDVLDYVRRFFTLLSTKISE
jgi:hypothetical protein